VSQIGTPATACREKTSVCVWTLSYRGIVSVSDFDAVDVEDPSADAVMPTCVLLVAVVAEAQPMVLPQLQLASEAHSTGEGLRIVDLDVEAERRLKAPGEELDTLFLVEAASSGEERLEAVLVVRDGAGALA